MTITLPEFTFTITKKEEEISNEPQRVLFVGQKTAAGTATSGELYANILNDNSWNTLFGINSMLAAMIRAARAENKVTRFDAIPLSNNPGGAIASGNFNIDGTATTAGQLIFVYGSRLNHSYTVDVALNETHTDIITALTSAINADLESPVDATAQATDVLLESVHSGEEQNFIGLEIIGSVAGLTTSVDAMTGGGTNPVLTDLFDVVGDERYQTIVWQSSYDITVLKSFLDTRFNEAGAPKDGVGTFYKIDTLANLITYGDALDSQSIHILGDKTVSLTNYKGAYVKELNYVIASQFAAIRSLRLTKDADIARYITAPNPGRDVFGGAAISALPYHNTPFPNLPLIDVNKGWKKDEREQLLSAGISVIGNNPSRNTVICADQVSTYKTDAAGNPDETFKYLNYVDTEVAVREFFYNNLKVVYSQSRLTEGALTPNRVIANAPQIGGELDGLFVRLGSEDYVLCQSGNDAVKYFKANRTITLNMADGEVIIVMAVPIQTQVRKFLINMQVSFEI